MPNRIIRESICTNEQIDQLNAFEETVFYRLIVNVDDYGRMDGRPAVLRSRLFPLKNYRDSQIEAALITLASVELVEMYSVHGKPFVRLSGWDRNQAIRAKKSKYPSPEEADETSSASTCMQMISDASKCLRNPIQSESESEAETREAAATIYAYASGNLQSLSPRNMEELDSFTEDMDEDVIRYAIDEACANGKRTWAYTRAILNRCVQDGVKSIGDIKAREQKREKPAGKPAETAKAPKFFD